jgi:hypothetical protein
MDKPNFTRRFEDQIAGLGERQGVGNEDFDRAGHINLGDPNSPNGEQVRGIVESKLKTIRPDRRMHGAGRRKGDLNRALKTGEEVIYQFGKGAWANAGKLAKKIISKKLKLGP